MKKGFTLVELMVSITIVGILAAIALPQFGNALARARAAEAPSNLTKIRTAQEAYKVETKKYKTGICSWGVDASGNPYLSGSQQAGIDLGVRITKSKFFNYQSDAPTTGLTYVASANLIKTIGGAEANKAVVTVDQDNNRTVTGETAASMELYLKTFLD